MKKKLMIVIVSSASLTINSAFAERSTTQQTLLETGTFTGLSIAGAVAAGPVGMVVGAISGAFLATESRTANASEKALAREAEIIQELEEDLMQKDQQLSQIKQDHAEKLTFQVMFASGDDSLTELDLQRVEKLAAFLQSHPTLSVNLDGHTDMRGTDEYNNVLSLERARAVKKALVSYGVDDGRITCKGLGSSFATAPKGDDAGYAKDRKVMIELIESSNINSVAQF